ncbi:hypothetical protein KAK07_24725 [Ideonella sp. 4Y16]|uniref:Carbamoyltransferase n=1 Tax=Ideonella alba TaxID=2824118 RepID=A0A940YJI2_9BURK|nr:carbamoyltransferase C-terminal domain-containing protein [Ideonella alba]MBQ0933552.1 hypothetical protein [Ideonella alba]MBQ0946559.1 hypothetical protein [Ideonella alba]
MITLGIAGLAHDAAAAVVEDGRVRFALEEERVTRRKNQWGFPFESCRAALAMCGLTPRDIDRVAFYWDDRAALIPAVLSELRGALDVRRPTLARIVRRWKAVGSNRLVRQALQEIWKNGALPPIDFVDHHLAHALYAHRSSGFERALSVVIDGRGEYASLTVYRCDADRVSCIQRVAMPSSLGFVYGAVTQHLGFHPAADEYRVMGLASFGQQDSALDRFFAALLPITPNGFKVNLHYTRYQHAESTDRRWLSEAVDTVLGPPRHRDGPIESRHADIARALQSRYEEVVLRILSGLARQDPGLPLTLSGGCAMNSVCNGRIFRESGFRDFFVPPAPGDQGAAIGAAFRGFSFRETARHVEFNRRAQVGPRYTREEVEHAVQARGLSPEQNKDPRARVIDLLCQGKVGAVFYGALEFGPRALGGRSILADARRADMKDRVNSKVKFREQFRPFAAAILRERTREYTGHDFRSDYMNLVMPLLSSKRAVVPAVVHEDGSCRFQTVCDLSDSVLRDLLRRFDERTGVPMLLNTSFNVNGEPIVMSPADAINCYLGTDIDFLLMEDVLLCKAAALESQC